MLDFFKRLLSSSTDESSKRFAGLFTLINAIVMAYSSVLFGTNLPEFIFNGLLFYSATALGLTVIEGFNKMKNKS